MIKNHPLLTGWNQNEFPYNDYSKSWAESVMKSTPKRCILSILRPPVILASWQWTYHYLLLVLFLEKDRHIFLQNSIFSKTTTYSFLSRTPWSWWENPCSHPGGGRAALPAQGYVSHRPRGWGWQTAPWTAPCLCDTAPGRAGSGPGGQQPHGYSPSNSSSGTWPLEGKD